jgi:AraC-like DNA-binding protein
MLRNFSRSEHHDSSTERSESDDRRFREESALQFIPFYPASRDGDACARHVTVSTSAFDVDDRVDFWCGLYRDFAAVEPDTDQPTAFAAREETWRLGALAVTQATTTGTSFLRRLSRCAAENGDLWVFRLSRGPAWTSVGEDGIERVETGQLWMKRTTRSSLTVTPAGDYTILTVPADACPELTAGLSHLPAGVQKGAGAGVLADVLAALPARLRNTPASGLEPLSDVLRAVIACSLLVDLQMAGGQAAAKEPQLRDRVTRVIAENIGSARLDVERICRLTGVSRSVLYRMFKRDGGVASHVREVRLRLVLADLQHAALAHMPIARIAERRGLHNAASFSRAFRRAFGCSPSEARTAAALGVPPAALARARCGGFGREAFLSGGR